MVMAIFKSVFEASLISAMVFISIIRLGMIAYPETSLAGDDSTTQTLSETVELPVDQSRIVTPLTKRRIILGQNSIENLGRVK